jgi:hypothetical protein
MRTYCQLSADFWVDVTDADAPFATRQQSIVRLPMDAIRSGLTVKTAGRLRALGFPKMPTFLTCVYRADRLISLLPIPIFLGIPIVPSLSVFRERAILHVETFRHKTKQSLMDAVFSGSATLDSVLAAFARYAFFQEYSLWLYNPVTEYFTHMCSSFDVQTTYLEKDHPQSPLGRVLSAGEDTIFSTVDHTSVNSQHLEDMTWVNRFAVRVKIGETEKDLVAVVSFYSQLNGYILREETKKTVSEVLTLELSKTVLTYMFHYNQVVEQLRNLRDMESVVPTLQNFVCSVSANFGYEAVSLLLLEKQTSDKLRLVALEEDKRRDVSALNIVYPVTGNSITASVFRDHSVRCSYAIQTDKGASGFVGGNWSGLGVIGMARHAGIGV